ncbi:hypothetical protein BATDEDRAFT_91740 [Batrachochytrium dendrobatidis JAM81]|uniref:Uncharacterized protein n=1 Tax=Batrachochytrium dendrobatidis (strain JAM81 / FGSC 10211) TaxID=684364 RepID=F4PBU0_BATDJ|nr:uncharacterized protein BATDEDRAFT_91740 [Batrachochytrium dendrobatidis JAM81]EGF77507.1 hypothetical protein BATDEDRAFT_91740 [Batrachochytrium dendrobatidis JAM81]KAJ8329996.1 hypothetical protein O5D80_001926 [Batrachochytrium dendrobatidis]KAK5669145.1 hypothetical protein QVD99_003555 [Batrachochytrium dendrobatidis]|eukprot:XP_006682101.1 hypothetical protein BATDEDRAFT_91740 [Batrachochytrium dendrobatidis JAM81]
MIFRRGLPTLNFFIGTTALSFQFFVLYPWHMELDKEFHKLEKTHKQVLEEFHQAKMTKLNGIEHSLQELKEVAIPLMTKK